MSGAILIGQTVEEKLVALEKKVSTMANVINTLAMSLSETTQKNSEIGMHLAAILRAIQDGRPLNADSLAESSIVNMVDKIDGHVKTALERNYLTVGSVIEESSIVCLRQTDVHGNEVNRKLLMNLHEQDQEVKALFVGKKVADVISGSLDNSENIFNFIVLEVYQPTETLSQEIK